MRATFPATLALLAACAAGSFDQRAGESLPIVGITGVDTGEIAVGEPLELLGDGFPSASEGWVDVRFVGEYAIDAGEVVDVDLTIPLQVGADGRLTWDRFGGYRVPFVDSGDRTGVFDGQISATHRWFDGSAQEQPEEGRPRVRLRVLPSLVVTDFRAVGDTWVSDCLEPAPNALHHVPYALRVKAIGFSPETIELDVSEGLLVDGEVTTDTTRLTLEPDEDGGHGVLMQFAGVPENVDGYAMSVNASAEADGVRADVVYPFVVRRPLEVYFTRTMEVAELLEPEPVSGCIPGGPSSVEVEYSESHSETRTRSIQQTTTRGWERTLGTEHEESWSESESEGGSETATNTVSMSDATTHGGSVTTTDMFSATSSRSRTHSVDFSASSSDTYDWSVGGERGWSTGNEEYHENNWEAGGGVSGGVNLGIFQIGAEGNGKRGFVNGERTTTGESGSVNATVGGSSSDSTTVSGGESATSTASATEARSRAVGQHWGRTQTYTESASFSRSQTWDRTRTRGEAVRQSQSIAESLGLSESETFTVSTTDARSLSVRASVWAGSYGMWYRQTTRLVRRGRVVAYDLCGNGTEVGQLRLEDWTWAPDLAIGEECPPPSNLPEASCRVPPCGG